MIRFETQEQKDLVIEALEGVSVPVIHARQAADTLDAVRAATVGSVAAPATPKKGARRR